ncbi:pseudouridine synthase [Blattabacterium cuenoti]|uniref:pseudouridine synthase n=1 Tax=Blattabacterium cuenoti TaxID=1653831 RepID=UPI00163B83BE|nr:pseudouridine synthase [Blattabacterium cuenoti]
MFNKKKIRLNHYLSYAGIASRRKSDKLIQSGIVEVNNKPIYQLGYTINIDHDVVKFNGEKIVIKNRIYILLNKPKGFITTTKDKFYRKTIMDLIPNYYYKYKLFPVGRLDLSTTGILLITNDGILSQMLTHPKYHVQKIYKVILNKTIKIQDLNIIEKGNLYLKEGRVRINFIKRLKRNEIKIGLCIGWNRIIKRIFNKLNYKVVRLDRIAFGNLYKKNISVGDFRFLQKNEIMKIWKNNEKNKYY